MAKKKTPPPVPAPKRMGRPPTAEGARKPAVMVRGRDEWKDWLARFAESERSDISDLVDDALAAHAKARGFEAPPKR